jgi:hypothetical protein
VRLGSRLVRRYRTWWGTLSRRVRQACHAVLLVLLVGLIAAAPTRTPAEHVAPGELSATDTAPDAASGTTGPTDRPTFGTTIVSRMRREPAWVFDLPARMADFVPLTGMMWRVGWGEPVAPRNGAVSTPSAARNSSPVPLDQPAVLMTIIGLMVITAFRLARRRAAMTGGHTGSTVSGPDPDEPRPEATGAGRVVPHAAGGPPHQRPLAEDECAEEPSGDTRWNGQAGPSADGSRVPDKRAEPPRSSADRRVDVTKDVSRGGSPEPGSAPTPSEGAPDRSTASGFRSRRLLASPGSGVRLDQPDPRSRVQLLVKPERQTR